MDLGPAKLILGMRINQVNNQVTLDQSHYINNILNTFNMQNCKPTSIPITPGDQIEDSNPTNKTTYMKLIRSLIYLTVVTRPDISFAVSKASKAMQNPTLSNWKQAKKILQYLQGTIHYKISYNQVENNKLTGYCDSDWAGDTTSRKSTSGYLYTLGGAAISWASQQQHLVALSSTEAELISGTTAIQEAIHLRQLMEDLGFQQTTATTLFQDN